MHLLAPDQRPVLAGIFVGGRGSRMGGVAKGLLSAPDGDPIVVRTKRIFDELGIPSVLVGAHPAYRELGMETLPDDPAAEGPLSGILALLGRAEGWAIAVACDMPFLRSGLVRRLALAPPAPIVAPRTRDHERARDVWEPLFARYDRTVLSVARTFAMEGGRKLQLLLETAGARPLQLEPEEERWLTDWDTLPATVTRESKEG